MVSSAALQTKKKEVSSDSSSAVDKTEASKPIAISKDEPVATLKDERPPCCFWKYQKRVQEIYDAKEAQLVVAAIIIGNFLMNIVQAQMDASGEMYAGTWEDLELFFNIVFAVELFVNMYGHDAKTFWRSNWNLFDTVVVSIGCLDILRVDLPGPLKMIRMMRAFRVFRLFKRIESLNKIIKALGRAIPGVMNAFLIMIIVMSIFAVLGVEFFREAGGCPSSSDVFHTSRGMCFGDEYFGTFFRSLYTLFQVLTGDSWSEAVVRPILMSAPHSWVENIGATIYFVLFILINAIILINVVVAVLLEKTMNDDEEENNDLPALGEAEAVAEIDKQLEAEEEQNNRKPVPVEETSGNANADELQVEILQLTSRVDDLRGQMEEFQGKIRRQVSIISTTLQIGLTV